MSYNGEGEGYPPPPPHGGIVPRRTYSPQRVVVTASTCPKPYAISARQRACHPVGCGHTKATTHQCARYIVYRRKRFGAGATSLRSPAPAPNPLRVPLSCAGFWYSTALLCPVRFAHASPLPCLIASGFAHPPRCCFHVVVAISEKKCAVGLALNDSIAIFAKNNKYKTIQL